MKRFFIFVLAVFTAVGMTVAGCKKQEELKPVPKAGQKKKASSSKKSSTTKKTATSTDTKSSKKTPSQKKKELDVPSL
ncbi:MAG: hypothetical protein AABZ10_11645 [Nitrospirota bacterium]